MITGVSIWRCSCGLTMKVITETDRTRMTESREKLTALCPNCHAEHVVNAHRIVSLTTEKKHNPFHDLAVSEDH
jgi:hypothetical protein